ncbi:unnamed protein product [Nippostrongylus brasiliensis]|uniref:Uncharacterized protein n=1 Tax=Nippostrongylus brasiliensis TaxID=27835 RepID=A0A0N4XNX0_NIPBR|nr:unnamed protein product [Nippostrongylus brasiliensis]
MHDDDMRQVAHALLPSTDSIDCFSPINYTKSMLELAAEIRQADTLLKDSSKCQPAPSICVFHSTAENRASKSLPKKG